jgi:hypothetical protein
MKCSLVFRLLNKQNKPKVTGGDSNLLTITNIGTETHTITWTQIHFNLWSFHLNFQDQKEHKKFQFMTIPMGHTRSHMTFLQEKTPSMSNSEERVSLVFLWSSMCLKTSTQSIREQKTLTENWECNSILLSCCSYFCCCYSFSKYNILFSSSLTIFWLFCSLLVTHRHKFFSLKIFGNTQCFDCWSNKKSLIHPSIWTFPFVTRA